MARYLLPLIVACASAIGATGCAFSSADETQAPKPAATDVHDGEDHPAEPVEPYHKQEPPDPCKTGMPIVIDGRTLRIPVPCDKNWVDKGDPPPEDV